jgi:hypothetical protein
MNHGNILIAFTVFFNVLTLFMVIKQSLHSAKDIKNTQYELLTGRNIVFWMILLFLQVYFIMRLLSEYTSFYVEHDIISDNLFIIRLVQKLSMAQCLILAAFMQVRIGYFIVFIKIEQWVYKVLNPGYKNE